MNILCDHSILIIFGILRRRCFFCRLLRVRCLRGLCLLVQFNNGLTGTVGQAIVGIVPQKILEGRARRLRVVEIVFIDLADREQAVKAILAARIFPAQKLVLLDGLVKDFVVVETPPHFHQRLGHRNHTGISLG